MYVCSSISTGEFEILSSQVQPFYILVESLWVNVLTSNFSIFGFIVHLIMIPYYIIHLKSNVQSKKSYVHGGIF